MLVERALAVLTCSGNHEALADATMPRNGNSPADHLTYNSRIRRCKHDEWTQSSTFASYRPPSLRPAWRVFAVYMHKAPWQGVIWHLVIVMLVLLGSAVRRAFAPA